MMWDQLDNLTNYMFVCFQELSPEEEEEEPWAEEALPNDDVSRSNSVISLNKEKKKTTLCSGVVFC